MYIQIYARMYTIILPMQHHNSIIIAIGISSVHLLLKFCLLKMKIYMAISILNYTLYSYPLKMYNYIHTFFIFL